MSYVALATEAFDAVVHFYGELLGFPTVAAWDRPNGRGRRFDLGGLRLEILDNTREPVPLALGVPGGRFHVVIEVADIGAARSRLPAEAAWPERTSWGATLFQIKDPDGIAVTFLQWEAGPGAIPAAITTVGDQP